MKVGMSRIFEDRYPPRYQGGAECCRYTRLPSGWSMGSCELASSGRRLGLFCLWCAVEVEYFFLVQIFFVFLVILLYLTRKRLIFF